MPDSRSAFGVEHPGGDRLDKAAPPTRAQLDRRRRLQAGLLTAGGSVGLAALGTKTGGAIIRRSLKPAKRAAALADKLETHTSTALAGGAGIGAAAAFNQASISRAEASGAGRRTVAKADRLVRRYGLSGAPPPGLDRDTREAIWSARDKHLNRKRNRWDRRGKGAQVVGAAAGTVVGTVGAAAAGTGLRDAYRAEHGEARLARGGASLQQALNRTSLSAPRTAHITHAVMHSKPGYRTLGLGAGAALTTLGARHMHTLSAAKSRKYSTAAGGTAERAVATMKDTPVSKAFTPKQLSVGFHTGRSLRSGEGMARALGAPHGPLKAVSRQARQVLGAKAGTAGRVGQHVGRHSGGYLVATGTGAGLGTGAATSAYTRRRNASVAKSAFGIDKADREPGLRSAREGYHAGRVIRDADRIARRTTDPWAAAHMAAGSADVREGAARYGTLRMRAGVHAGRHSPSRRRRPVAKSAFGIEHGPAPVSKAFGSGVVEAAKTGMKGFAHGAKGGSFGAAPGTTAGMLGAKAGNVTRGVLKPVAGVAQKAQAAPWGAPVAAGAAGLGAGVAGTSLVNRKR